jgi:hypothetical protein
LNHILQSLKLTSYGLKESESLIPSYGFDDPIALPPTPSDYRLATHRICTCLRRTMNEARRVAEEFTLDMHGCMEFTPGKPGTLCLWQPLTLPERF